MYPPSGIFLFPQKPNNWTTVCLYMDNSEQLKIQNWHFLKFSDRFDQIKASLWFRKKFSSVLSLKWLAPFMYLVWYSRDNALWWVIFAFHVYCFLTFFLSVFLSRIDSCINNCDLFFNFWFHSHSIFNLLICFETLFRCQSVFLAQQVPFKKVLFHHFNFELPFYCVFSSSIEINFSTCISSLLQISLSSKTDSSSTVYVFSPPAAIHSHRLHTGYVGLISIILTSSTGNFVNTF